MALQCIFMSCCVVFFPTSLSIELSSYCYPHTSFYMLPSHRLMLLLIVPDVCNSFILKKTTTTATFYNFWNRKCISWLQEESSEDCLQKISVRNPRLPFPLASSQLQRESSSGLLSPRAFLKTQTWEMWIPALKFLGCEPRERRQTLSFGQFWLWKRDELCVSPAAFTHQGNTGTTGKHNGKGSWLHTILNIRKKSLGIISPSARKLF